MMPEILLLKSTDETDLNEDTLFMSSQLQIIRVKFVRVWCPSGI